VAGDHTVAPGETIAGYELERLVGRGGMGDVYLARDLRLERPVALKILAPRLSGDPAFRERMLRESRLAAALDHPNVVPIYEAGESEGRLFLAMRYVDGDLRHLLREEHALAPARAVAIVTQIAAALDAAHARGLVHRDVKPSNVLLDRQDGREHAYLADFGLVQSASDRGPTDGQSLGTVDYAAPEQIRGEHVDGRADVYALGCLLYESLTGEVPFARSSEVATIFAHLHEEPPLTSASRRELPQGIDPVLTRALAKEPGSRQATCGQVAAEAREALGLVPAARARSRLVGLGLGLAAVAIVAVALVGRFTATGSSAPPVGHIVGIDPRTNAVASVHDVSANPGVVTTAAGSVWAGDFRDGSLWRLDPSSGIVDRLTSTGEPRDLTSLGGSVYVAADGTTAYDGSVTRYDAATGGREASVSVLACSVAAGDGVLWAAGCPFVDRISTGPDSMKIIHVTRIPYAQPRSAETNRLALRDMAVGYGAVWVLGDPVDRRVFRLDLRSGRILGATVLPSAPRSIAAGAGAIWVTGPIDDTLTRLDPTNGRVDGTVRVPAGAGGVAAAGGSVWVASGLDRSVSRVDPRSLRIEATIKVPGAPREVAVGAGGVWVTTVAD
jgi:streptogramin lyase